MSNKTKRCFQDMQKKPLGFFEKGSKHSWKRWCFFVATLKVYWRLLTHWAPMGGMGWTGSWQMFLGCRLKMRKNTAVHTQKKVLVWRQLFAASTQLTCENIQKTNCLLYSFGSLNIIETYWNCNRLSVRLLQFASLPLKCALFQSTSIPIVQ